MTYLLLWGWIPLDQYEGLFGDSGFYPASVFFDYVIYHFG